jgi:hypothetical protein
MHLPCSAIPVQIVVLLGTMGQLICILKVTLQLAKLIMSDESRVCRRRRAINLTSVYPPILSSRGRAVRTEALIERLGPFIRYQEVVSSETCICVAVLSGL